MALTAAEKQHRRRERLKARGLVHVQGWVTPEQAGAIKAIMQGLPVVFNAEADTVTNHQPEAPATSHSEHTPVSPSEAPAGQAKTPARIYSTGEEPEGIQRASTGERPQPLKAPFGEAAKPTLKKGDRPGVWRVLIGGEEIGTVQKEHHAAFAGSPAFDRWKPSRKGSMLDALSERTCKTRAQAVQALVRDYTPEG